jgi:hypothetical protein
VPADAAFSVDATADRTFTPVDAVTQVEDSAAPPDLSSDLCSGACALYEADYAAALVRARACTPGMKVDCGLTAAASLHCGCNVWVTSTMELADIRAQWMAAGCDRCRVLCPAIACRGLTTGVCRAKMLGAGGGVCADKGDPVPF